MFQQTIHFWLPFLWLYSTVFPRILWHFIKAARRWYCPLSRSEINSSFIASGNAGAAVRTFDGFSQLQDLWSILYLHPHWSLIYCGRHLLPLPLSLISVHLLLYNDQVVIFLLILFFYCRLFLFFYSDLEFHFFFSHDLAYNIWDGEKRTFRIKMGHYSSHWDWILMGYVFCSCNIYECRLKFSKGTCDWATFFGYPTWDTLKREKWTSKAAKHSPREHLASV